MLPMNVCETARSLKRRAFATLAAPSLAKLATGPIASPVERVWDALTDSQLIARWMMSTDDFEAKVGAHFTLRDQPRPVVTATSSARCSSSRRPTAWAGHGPARTIPRRLASHRTRC
jgi:hypothetical protein